MNFTMRRRHCPQPASAALPAYQRASALCAHQTKTAGSTTAGLCQPLLLQPLLGLFQPLHHLHIGGVIRR